MEGVANDLGESSTINALLQARICYPTVLRKLAYRADSPFH